MLQSRADRLVADTPDHPHDLHDLNEWGYDTRLASLSLTAGILFGDAVHGDAYTPLDADGLVAEDDLTVPLTIADAATHISIAWAATDPAATISTFDPLGGLVVERPSPLIVALPPEQATTRVILAVHSEMQTVRHVTLDLTRVPVE